jgi:signal transduction histidine kinase
LQAAVASLESEMLERQRLEEERETIQERMLESQRLESIGRLAGGVAHDFTNLLTAIVGYSDLASNRPTLEEAQGDLSGTASALDHRQLPSGVTFLEKPFTCPNGDGGCRLPIPRVQQRHRRPCGRLRVEPT